MRERLQCFSQPASLITYRRRQMSNLTNLHMILFLFFFFLWVTGELSTLRQMMKVPNETGLTPNNGLENAFLSDQSIANNRRKGQAKRFGSKTTSYDGKAGHVMTHVCHRARQQQRQVRACKRQCRKHATLYIAQRLDRLNCRAKQCQVSTSS